MILAENDLNCGIQTIDESLCRGGLLIPIIG